MSSEKQDPLAMLRRRMVDEQIRSRGVSDERVLEAMATVPRECFVAAEQEASALADRALPIDHGQTISQPYIVAYMTDLLALTPNCRVLEIGTGTGYQTAILAGLCRWVYSVERVEDLHRQAATRLADLDIRNVTLRIGDGSAGLLDEAPFDRVIVTAAAPRIPHALVEQLTETGRLVIPVGGRQEQTIVLVTRQHGQIIEKPTIACRFVKLIGQDAWKMEDVED